MLGALQSLPLRPLNLLCTRKGALEKRRPQTGGQATGPDSSQWGGWGVLLFSCLALASCRKEESAKSASFSAPSASVAPSNFGETSGSAPKLDAEIESALATPASDRSVTQSPAQLREEAESILAKYPGKNAAELLGVPEVNEKLRTALQKLGQDKSLQARIESSVELAGQIKGLEGAAKLDLDVTKYDAPRTAKMLEVVLSEDPKNIVNFLEGEIGEAVPDIAYGGVERAPNGVSIVPDPTKNKPAVKPELPE